MQRIVYCYGFIKPDLAVSVDPEYATVRLEEKEGKYQDVDTGLNFPTVLGINNKNGFYTNCEGYIIFGHAEHYIVNDKGSEDNALMKAEMGRKKAYVKALEQVLKQKYQEHKNLLERIEKNFRETVEFERKLTELKS